MKPYPRYDIYKDSGIEWLGEIPAHWEVERLKNLLVQTKEIVSVLRNTR